MNGWHDDNHSAEDRALDRLLDSLPEVEASPGFRDRVLRAVAAEGRAPFGRRLGWRRAAAVAAGIMLLAAGWFLIDRDRAPSIPDDGQAAAESVVQALEELSDLDLLALEVDELDSIHDDWFGG